MVINLKLSSTGSRLYAVYVTLPTGPVNLTSMCKLHGSLALSEDELEFARTHGLEDLVSSGVVIVSDGLRAEKSDLPEHVQAAENSVAMNVDYMDGQHAQLPEATDLEPTKTVLQALGETDETDETEAVSTPVPAPGLEVVEPAPGLEVVEPAPGLEVVEPAPQPKKSKRK